LVFAFRFRLLLSLFLLLSLLLSLVAGSRFRVGLLALPLCGAALTFFAAAKKVSKESSFSGPRSHAIWVVLSSTVALA
jgi:hypothetical protein